MQKMAAKTVVSDTKLALELLTRLQETLNRVSDKNDSLLESIETSETRAQERGGEEASLLRNLRARLAATHAPNVALKRDLGTFAGTFEKRYRDLDGYLKENQALQVQLKRNERDLEQRIKNYEEERKQFEEERAIWKEELERERIEAIEQNDRLTVLSEQLAGVKVELDRKKSDLASQRIAFEEEKLERINSDGPALDSEAEALRLKLKEQVIRNVRLENALLQTELSLHQKEGALLELDGRNDRLQQDILQSRMASSRAVKQFEKRTMEANKKLSQMNSELSNAHEHARRFQDMLAAERRKQKGLKHALEQELQKKSTSRGGDGMSTAAQRAYIDTLSETLIGTGKAQNPMRVDDVVKKNEVVLVESANLKAEIRRLRIENGDLMKRVRFADTNAHYMRNQVVANVADRAELVKRLEKAEAQYHSLDQSLSKQAADWVSSKQKQTKSERAIKWSKIEPVSVLGASERTWNSAPSSGRSQALSRSIQVHKW